MSKGIPEGISRRELLRQGALLGGSGLFLSTLGAPWSRLLAATQACPGTLPGRYLQIVLSGGWDSSLATDPVVGSKASSAAYQPVYQTLETSTVSGKNSLVVGAGLDTALPAFQALPTAFVNGMLVEVTAHELASAYLMTGRLSLSRSREYPACSALLGAGAGCFPAHVVVGESIPLGDTRQTHPPLHASSMESMRGMLAGPLSGDEPLDPGVLNDAQTAVDALNQLHMAKQGVKAQELLQPWVTSEQSMMDLYSRGYAQQFQLTSELSERYGVEDLWDEFAVLPGALMVLKSGLCPFVTVTIDGFDTHEDHLTSHTALLRSFGTGLSALVEDLQVTPDPDDPERSLAETTTIAITSEFVRTPLFNLADGTDHWPSGSMILMGRGIQDGVVVGATGDDAFALGWANDAAVERDATTALKPEHVVATVLDIAGLGSEALSEISEVRIDALRG